MGYDIYEHLYTGSHEGRFNCLKKGEVRTSRCCLHSTGKSSTSCCPVDDYNPVHQHEPTRVAMGGMHFHPNHIDGVCFLYAVKYFKFRSLAQIPKIDKIPFQQQIVQDGSNELHIYIWGSRLVFMDLMLAFPVSPFSPTLLQP